MRDLKRPNASRPAYIELESLGFEVFTPLTEVIETRAGRRSRVTVPYIRDLLFVHTSRERLDPLVAKTPTLQYRYAKGLPYRQPITVPEREMQMFVTAVATLKTPMYVTPGELTDKMVGAKVRIISEGPFDGYESRLVSIKGSRKKRIMVSLQGFLAALVEVSPTDYVELL